MAQKPGEDNGLSGVPEEWGRIVVPDDISELDDLVGEIQDELRYDSQLARRERRLPFIVLAVTVIITLASLFTVPWLGRMGQTEPQPRPAVTTSVSPGESSPSQACSGEADCGTSTGVSRAE